MLLPGTMSPCYLEYFGETVHELSERINYHKSGFRHSPKQCHYCVISNLFNKSKGASVKVQILKKNEGNEQANRGTMDPSITQIRKTIETTWIKTVKTAYPYGLNDLACEDYSKDKIKVVRVKFPSLTR